MHLYNDLLNKTTIPSLLKIFISLDKLGLFAAARNHKGLATFNLNFLKNVYFLQMARLNYINTVSKLNPQMYSFLPQKLQNHL